MLYECKDNTFFQYYTIFYKKKLIFYFNIFFLLCFYRTEYGKYWLLSKEYMD